MNNCTCDVYPDEQMRYWEVACSCDNSGGGDLDNYYTKIQTDARIQRAKDDVENDIEWLARDIEAIETDIADTYSKEETDTKLSLKANLSDVYDKTATDGLLATKASTATTADLQAQINSKQDILVSGVNVKTLNGESLLGSGNISITGVSPEQVETMIDEAVSGKQDTSGMTAYTTTATTAAIQSQINGKQDTLVSGVSIKTLNGETLLGSGDIVITGGGGVTSGEVETMIDAAVSGKQDTSGMTAYTTTATTDSLSGTVTGHTSDQTIHVTAADKNTWNTVSTKADITALTAVNGVLTAHTADTVVHVTQANKNAWNSKLDPSALNGYATQQWVEGKGYITGYTETDPVFTGSPAFSITNADKTNWDTVTGKADTTAVTQVNNALTAHTADTAIHVTAADKANLNTVTGKADTSAVTQVNNALTAHTADTAIHVTAADKTNWDTVSTKADTTAVTQVNNALTAHTSDTTVHTNATEKTAWNGAATNATQALSQLNGYSLLKISKSAFDALATKNPTTIYLVYQD